MIYIYIYVHISYTSLSLSLSLSLAILPQSADASRTLSLSFEVDIRKIIGREQETGKKEEDIDEVGRNPAIHDSLHHFDGCNGYDDANDRKSEAKRQTLILVPEKM